MRYSHQMYERRRLEVRGLSPIRNQFDTDTSRPNFWLNLLCFTLPLMLGKMVFSHASMSERGTVILFNGVALLMTMTIFAVLRPKRIVGQAFMFALLSMALMLTVFVGMTPPGLLRSFFHMP